MTEPIWLDERGRRCPLPIVALMRAAQATPGAVVAVLADDPAAEFDIPAWCRLKGAQFLGTTPPPDRGSGTGYLVQLPVDRLPVDQVPVDRLPVDQVPVDQVPVDQVPVDQVPVDDASRD